MDLWGGVGGGGGSYSSGSGFSGSRSESPPRDSPPRDSRRESVLMLRVDILAYPVRNVCVASQRGHGRHSVAAVDVRAQGSAGWQPT